MKQNESDTSQNDDLAVLRAQADEVRNALENLNLSMMRAYAKGLQVNVDVREDHSIGDTYGRPIITVSVVRPV